MNVTVSQADLTHALAAIRPAIAGRPSHPILCNVLLATTASGVTLSGFDLSLGISVAIAAEATSTGRAALPYALLAPLVAKLPDAALTLQVKNGKATLTSTCGVYNLAVAVADDYPDLMAPGAAATAVVLPAIELQAAIAATQHAASRDQSNQVLQGLSLCADAAAIEAAATDGHRLSVYGPHRSPDLPRVTVPAAVLRHVAGLAGDVITLTRDATVVRFSNDRITITSRTIDGTYPNYRQLIPKSFTHNITIDRRSMAEALERVAVLADQHNSIVKLSIRDGQLTIRAEIQDLGSGVETLAVDSTTDADAAFNVRYLLDGLKVLPTTQVRLSMNTPTAPAILAPVDGDTLQTYLIMPVTVRT
jgi:DNA polymerase III subunit beta